MWAGPSSVQNRWANIGPKWLGQSRPRIFSFLVLSVGLDPAQTFGLGQHWPDPYAMLIICRT
jgi:hypothetical protein